MSAIDPQPAMTRISSPPSQALPVRAWDTHAHVFGPFDRFPLAADCRYQPPFAPCDAHQAMLDTAGFTHGVLVHASANGFDNSGVLHAVALNPSRNLAIAVVPEDIGDSELRRLHEAGVRGLRFTENGEHIGAPKPSGTLGLDALRRMAPRLQELGWHAQIWAKCQFLVDSRSWLESCGIPLVIDHMGMFDVARGVNDAIFQGFLGLVDQGTTWVKLTTTRVTKQRWNDCADVRPFHDALLARAPDRTVWGSDWPYIGMDKDIPDVGHQIDLFDSWTLDADLRQKVFVTNPQALYGTLS
jgi:2-pyrone-4,6-dicarboxylate lactonase